jgi:hypothetical protein
MVVEMFEDAGFVVETPNHARYSNKDFYNLFDFMAVHSSMPVIFGQVKSSSASGINAFIDTCAEIFPSEYCQIYYVVYHKREGWRLIEIDLEEISRAVVVDERGNGKNMGVELTEYLAEMIEE